jgi:transcriptional regulator with XRE-family HTH domain
MSGMGNKREALADRREAMGFTQEKLATAVGVEFSTVGRWERGTLTPQPWRRPRIAKALGVSLDELDVLLGQRPAQDSPPFTGPTASGQAPVTSLVSNPSASAISAAYDPTTRVDVGAAPAKFLESLTMTVKAPRRIGWAEVEQVKLMTRTLAASPVFRTWAQVS